MSIKTWERRGSTMNITKRISNQLQRAPCDQAVKILASDEKLRVEVKLEDSGRLGCLLDRLNLEHTEDGHVMIDPVQIEGKITYLGERLEVIETEARQGRTILRSSPPRVEGEVISFFEMVVDGFKKLSLKRYEYDPKIGERMPVPAPLTRDTLERLINDLIERV
jgi:hypothetical protein